jgi:hypothetical protein
MTIDEMERVLESLDRRLATVEQILPTLAGKADLERFATKTDLERFATKTDLERFATKADLERFATKEDLERFATKEDLKRFATKVDLERFPTKQDLREGLDGARRHAEVLFEAVRDDVRLVAEGLASLIERLERKGII